jgi:hypothetical protein
MLNRRVWIIQVEGKSEEYWEEDTVYIPWVQTLGFFKLRSAVSKGRKIIPLYGMS